jgi:hypothetical protein
MKQRTGKKLHKRCEAIAGKPYRVCYTSGNYPHFVAECWFGEGDIVGDADWVDYIQNVVTPKFRNGVRCVS